MTTLTDFLLARISEDEEWEREHSEFKQAPDWVPPFWKRVSAECEAKRSIVELYCLFDDKVVAAQTRDEEQMAAALRDTVGLTLRALALPYAEHPDYREEWKP